MSSETIKVDGSKSPPVGDHHLEQLGFEFSHRKEITDHVFCRIFENLNRDHILDFGDGKFIIESKDVIRYDGKIKNPVILSMLLFSLELIEEDLFAKEPLKL